MSVNIHDAELSFEMNVVQQYNILKKRLLHLNSPSSKAEKHEIQSTIIQDFCNVVCGAECVKTARQVNQQQIRTLVKIKNYTKIVLVIILLVEALEHFTYGLLLDNHHPFANPYFNMDTTINDLNVTLHCNMYNKLLDYDNVLLHKKITESPPPQTYLRGSEMTQTFHPILKYTLLVFAGQVLESYRTCNLNRCKDWLIDINTLYSEVFSKSILFSNIIIWGFYNSLNILLMHQDQRLFVPYVNEYGLPIPVIEKLLKITNSGPKFNHYISRIVELSQFESLIPSVSTSLNAITDKSSVKEIKSAIASLANIETKKCTSKIGTFQRSINSKKYISILYMVAMYIFLKMFGYNNILPSYTPHWMHAYITAILCIFYVIVVNRNSFKEKLV